MIERPAVPAPLEGRRILVTRPARQAAGMAEPLEALGATVFGLPAIEIVPPESLDALDAALRDLDRFDWLVLTSVNGVEAVNARFDALGLDRSAGSRTKLAAVGPSTASAVREVLWEPDFVPDEYVGEAIAEGLGEVRGRRILLARADIARKDLPAILRARGAIVEEVAAYRIVRPPFEGRLPDAAPDWIAFTSSSAVHGTREALESAGRGEWMNRSRLACIGPITAATVRELGYEVALMAEEYTIAGLVAAIRADARTSLRAPASSERESLRA